MADVYSYDFRADTDDCGDPNYRRGTPPRLRSIIDAMRDGKRDEAVHMLLETIAKDPDEDEGIRGLLAAMRAKGYIGMDIFGQAVKEGYTPSQLELLGEFLGVSPKIAAAEERMQEESRRVNKGIAVSFLFTLGLAAAAYFGIKYFWPEEKAPEPAPIYETSD